MRHCKSADTPYISEEALQTIRFSAQNVRQGSLDWPPSIVNHCIHYQPTCAAGAGTSKNHKIFFEKISKLLKFCWSFVLEVNWTNRISNKTLSVKLYSTLWISSFYITVDSPITQNWRWLNFEANTSKASMSYGTKCLVTY